MTTPATVSVTIRLPKGILKFLKDLHNLTAQQWNLNEYLTSTIIQDIHATLDYLPSGYFDPKRICDKYSIPTE